MPFDLETLYNLLPAYLRARDAAPAPDGGDGRLRALLSLIDESIAVLEDDLAELYDDQFIETASAWAVPYIGDLIAYRPLHTLSGADIPPRVRHLLSERAQVANTLRYRRRKGTLAVLEDLARDVTGWQALAVEFFQRLGVTQHLNHLRPACQVTDLRHLAAQGGVISPFNSTARTAELRPIAKGEGRYNIPNIGIFVWRLKTFAVAGQPASASPSGDHDFFFNPLAADLALFAAPQPEDSVSHLAGPQNVPLAITRRRLHEDLNSPGTAPGLYGAGGSLQVVADGNPIMAAKILAADLTTDPNTHAWAHHPADHYALDPELGRLTAPAGQPAPGQIQVFYRFASPSGAGAVLDQAVLPPLSQDTRTQRLPQDSASLGAALSALAGAPSGEALVTDNRSIDPVPDLHAAAGQSLALRAAPGCRAALQLHGDWSLSGEPGSEIVLEGLLVSGAALVLPETVDLGSGPLPNQLHSLRLRRCTLVPGLSLNPDGSPSTPGAAGLVVRTPGMHVILENCIVGPLYVHPDSSLELHDSICDAGDSSAVAYAAPDGASFGGALAADACTFIGRVHASALDTVSSTIFASRFKPGERWPGVRPGRGPAAPVRADRRQVGCVSYSFVPAGSFIPRSFACHPKDAAEAAWLWPKFTSLRYGDPAYAQLAGSNPPAIWQGGEGEASPGAYHNLYEPQRLANLGIRLDEYLRFGLEAGVIMVP